MSNTFKSTLRGLTPPVIWNMLANKEKKKVKSIEQPLGEEKSAEYLTTILNLDIIQLGY